MHMCSVSGVHLGNIIHPGAPCGKAILMGEGGAWCFSLRAMEALICLSSHLWPFSLTFKTVQCPSMCTFNG